MIISHTLDKNRQYKHHAHVVDAYVILFGRERFLEDNLPSAVHNCMLWGNCLEAEGITTGSMSRPQKVKRGRK